MEELTNAINLKNTHPITDEVGKNLKPFRFKLTNTCGVGVDYNVNLEVMETESRIASKNIATKVDENTKSILSNNPTAPITYQESDYIGVEAYTIHSGSIKPYESVEHEVRIWLDESAGNDSQNGTFYSKVVIDARQNQIVSIYKEEILNGADPVVAEGLIPVEIDEKGVVTRANPASEWYSYEEKRWANAVILNDKNIEYKYKEEIPESNIESYFVWIPKYSYQIWDLGEYESLTSIDESKVHEIPIKFGLKNTSDENAGECTTPMNEDKTQGLSGESGACKIGDYMTPPAFITMGTNGLWVGKFETGYKGATSTTAAQVNASDSTKIQIKPNVYSWRSIQPANAHLASYNYKRELDSHMMKNTEWGAVAYLQHSKYGSSTSVRINNNSAYITGYAAKNEPTCGFTGKNELCNINESTNLGIDGTNTYNYKNVLSQVASTTGNYTGIYDMSGGASEYVMGILLNSDNSFPLSGRDSENNSGFNGPYSVGGSLTTGIDYPSTKYYDSYTYVSGTNTQKYQRRILGDGTGEMGPFAFVKSGANNVQVHSWYNDETWFVSENYPWFSRGSSIWYGTNGGITSFLGSTGPGNAFRIVLAI